MSYRVFRLFLAWILANRIYTFTLSFTRISWIYTRSFANSIFFIRDGSLFHVLRDCAINHERSDYTCSRERLKRVYAGADRCQSCTDSQLVTAIPTRIHSFSVFAEFLYSDRKDHFCWSYTLDILIVVSRKYNLDLHYQQPNFPTASNWL